MQNNHFLFPQINLAITKPLALKRYGTTAMNSEFVLHRNCGVGWAAMHWLLLNLRGTLSRMATSDLAEIAWH